MTSDTHHHQLRLLSYNIHKGIGGRDRRYRLQRIIDVIAHEDPDILCLQEVDFHVKRTRFDDQSHLIPSALNLPYQHFQLNHRIAAGGYGNLIASRIPLIEVRSIPLTLRGRKVRGAIVATVIVNNDRLRLVNWHLGLVEAERQWQVRHLLEHHQFRAMATPQTLILGDYNDWRNQLGTGPFAVHQYRHLTTPPSRFRTFPAWLPLGSLDKVYWQGPDSAAFHARVVRTKLAQQASDHLPLVIDLTIPNS